MNICILFGAIFHLLAFFANGATIISIKYPQDQPISSSTSFNSNHKYGYNRNSNTNSGIRTTTPAKRDLSLSYTATNIDSKEGTRVKTITVIKNVATSTRNNKKPDKLAINPDDLHKNNEWATVFRDNFESFGVLPDVPDVEELFEFVNRKTTDNKDKDKKGNDEKKETDVQLPVDKSKDSPKDDIPKKVPEVTTESESEAGAAANGAASDEAPVEKIHGDAELLPNTKQRNILRLQAQNAAAKNNRNPRGSKSRAAQTNLNFTITTKSQKLKQYYDNYVQELPSGYEYTKPCPSPPNSVSVATPSGKKYDIPLGNSSGTSGGNPYIAPAIGKKTQQNLNNTNGNGQNLFQPNYLSVNSILPPLQQPQLAPQTGTSPQQTTNPQQLPPQIIGIVPIQPIAALPLQPVAALQPPLGNTQPQVLNANTPQTQTSQQTGANVGVGISTSQRPYVAPKLRNGLGSSRGPAPAATLSSTPTTPLYLNVNVANGPGPSYRANTFVANANRPYTFRSRGLKY